MFLEETCKHQRRNDECQIFLHILNSAFYAEMYLLFQGSIGETLTAKNYLVDNFLGREEQQVESSIDFCLCDSCVRFL